MSREVVIVLVVMLCSFQSATFARDVVKWTDETGQLHFSDSMDSVPHRHRGQAKWRRSKKSGRLAVLALKAIALGQTIRTFRE